MNVSLARELSLIIVGPAGSGKTTLGDELASILDKPVYPSGQVFHDECKKRGVEIAKINEIPLPMQIELDMVTDNHIREVLGQNSIITSRTAAMFAHRQCKDGTLPRERYLAVGINCPYEVRGARKHGSLLSKAQPENILDVPTADKIAEDYRERDETDMTRYRFLYRSKYQVRGWDALLGAPPCDIVLNSETMSIEQEIQQVLALLGLLDNFNTNNK